jgi:hypothetical protein
MVHLQVNIPFGPCVRLPLLAYDPLPLTQSRSSNWVRDHEIPFVFHVVCTDEQLATIRKYEYSEFELDFTRPRITLGTCSITHFAQTSPQNYPWQEHRKRGHLPYAFTLIMAGIARSIFYTNWYALDHYTLARSTYRRPSLLRPLSPAEQAIFQPYGSRYA